VPVRRRSITRHVLTPAQRNELLSGPHHTPAFADEDDRRRAWEAHRHEITALCHGHGYPWGWWLYVARLDTGGDPDVLRGVDAVEVERAKQRWEMASIRARRWARERPCEPTYGASLRTWQVYWGLSPDGA